MEEELNKSPLGVFADFQETYEEAEQKLDGESLSFAKVKRFKMSSAGTYPVRILPLAPVQQPDGKWVLDRKGYEYPTQTLVLKLNNPSAKNKKESVIYVNVTHSKYAGISVDLIDTYVEAAQKYAENKATIKKITGNSFDGGLRWNYQRAMYMLDLNKRQDGIQLLTLSYAQYRELEDRKLSTWKKLLANDSHCACPISSVNGAYPIEIIRKEENKKTSYTINIDTLSGTSPLTQSDLDALLACPRLPEVLYRYTRYQLEATIEFLKQYDDALGIDVMSTAEVTTAIEKISLELPADDKSHFSFEKKGDKKSEDEDDAKSTITINSLWNRWEKLDERGIGDKSEEGAQLRDDIRTFIDENGLDIRVTRAKTNKDVLDEIDSYSEVSDDEEEKPEAPSTNQQAPGQGEDEPDEERRRQPRQTRRQL